MFDFIVLMIMNVSACGVFTYPITVLYLLLQANYAILASFFKKGSYFFVIKSCIVFMIKRLINKNGKAKKKLKSIYTLMKGTLKFLKEFF